MRKSDGLGMVVDDVWNAKVNGPLDGHGTKEAIHVPVQVSLSLKELICFVGSHVNENENEKRM